MNIEQAIELIEKWIADPESVSRKELKVARAGIAAAITRHAADAWVAVHAALNGDTYAAKYWVAEHHKIATYAAKYWVAEYHKITKE